jgi:exodeoxyribonuclease VII large subunit
MISLTVAQITGRIRLSLESDPLFGDVWVIGEISNLSRPASGHCYFSLKDEGAQLRCAFFRTKTTARALAALDHGAKVLAHGYVSVYEQRGELQLIVDAVRPAGVGLLQAEFERLSARLELEGLFDTARKRRLPAFPRKIAVVTSPSGAVFHDICHVLGRRWPLVEVLLAPTPVQGDAAGPGIVAALQRMNARDDIDVILLARGGGSMEDLWAFNGEGVARAIFASRIPVVSAVGHETDITIADHVADLRAPTPSAAAELLVPDQIEMAVRIGAGAQSLSSGMLRAFRGAQMELVGAGTRLRRCRPAPARLASAAALMGDNMRRIILRELSTRMERIDSRRQQLVTLSPNATLARGYALVHADDGLIVRAADAHSGDHLRVQMTDGSFGARVEPDGSAAPRIARPHPVASEQSRLL